MFSNFHNIIHPFKKKKKQKLLLELPSNCLQQNDLSLVKSEILYKNSLPNDKFSDWSKLRAFADDTINVI